jgi:hypothetical protein
MMKTIGVIAAVVLLLVGLSAEQAQGATAGPTEASPLGSYVDCQDSCRDCQKTCESKSAGSERSDCYRSCTAAAAGCCSGYGKRPPSGLTCTCQ